MKQERIQTPNILSYLSQNKNVGTIQRNTILNIHVMMKPGPSNMKIAVDN